MRLSLSRTARGFGALAATFLTFLFAVSPSWAKSPEEVRAQCAREHRPCVGLVLSGGGARGFAHVGVLKVLQELNIKVDVVTGTSMGSMVGGAYAAGYTAEQIEEIIHSVDWKRMFAVSPDRQDVPWRQKLDDYRNLSTNSIVITKKGEIAFPESIVPSQELSLFLEKETGVVNGINDLSDLAIPFKAVATDLVSGNRVELQKGINLAAAMRASMSVPGVFAPVNQYGKMLVDGGLVDNLPVQLARDMGADVIIAVNVGTPLMKREELTSVVTVMGQMVNLLTEQNVRRSIESLKSTDILITPNLEALNSTDMEQSGAMITAGYQAADALRKKLSALSVVPTQWIAWEQRRMHAVLPATRQNEHKVSAVKIEGLTYVNPERVEEELALDVSKPITNEEIEAATRRVWADGNFSHIRYHFEPQQDGTTILVFEPKEKKPGFASIRMGGSVETDFQSSQAFNLVFGHRWGWLNDWGGEWHNELQGGSVKRFTSEFFQPLGPTSLWFVQPRVEYVWQPFDVYRNDEAIARFRNEELMGEFDVGYSLGRNGFVKGTLGYLAARSRREIGEMDYNRDVIHTPYLSLSVYHDTLDNINFPTKGHRVELSLQRLFSDELGIANQTVFHASGLWPYSYGPWTVIAKADYAKAAIDNLFSIGGAFRMTGSPYNRWTGSNLEWGSLTISRNMSDLLQLHSNPVWLGLSLEMGRTWNRASDAWSDTNDKRFHKAIGMYVGVDSVIGPLFLMAGHTLDVGSGVYFFWGHPMR